MCRVKRTTNLLASVAVIATCQWGRPKREESSSAARMESSVGSIKVIPLLSCSAIASTEAGGECPVMAPVSPKQRSRVTDAIHVGEIGAAGFGYEHWVRTGPASHPIHGNTVEKMGSGTLEEL